MAEINPLPPLHSSPRATDCMIDVALAIAVRNAAAKLGLKAAPGGDLGFRYRECGEAVKPFDGPGARHFEHITHNPACSLSPGTS